MASPGIRFGGAGASGGSADFGRSTMEQVPAFIGLMRILHTEPTASAFARLLRKELLADDYVQLAHLFEEVSVLALHRLIAEELVFDTFAFDMYWDELREDVLEVRRLAGNEKFCENFEIAAERARAYRTDRPPKLRWMHRAGPDAPQDPHGGLGVRPPGPAPHDAPAEPAPEHAGRKE